MDELKAMRLFARVVDSGSFAQAARALDLAPAAVTRSVANLEQHLGARLITRTTRRNALTGIGERYLERVRRILREVDEAAALARANQRTAQGAVRVLAPPAFALHQLTQRLPRFHRLHPEVTVELAASAAVDSLDEAHDLTIVVRAAPLDGDFVARRLAHSALIACASPAYLVRHGRPSHPAELAAHGLLLPPTPRPLVFTQGDATVAVQPQRQPMHSASPELHEAGALAGFGIATLPSFAVESALREGRLEAVLPGWRLHDLSIWACMPTHRHVPASTRALLDFLLAEFGGRDHDPWAPAHQSEAQAQTCV